MKASNGNWSEHVLSAGDQTERD